MYIRKCWEIRQYYNNECLNKKIEIIGSEINGLRSKLEESVNMKKPLDLEEIIQQLDEISDFTNSN